MFDSVVFFYGEQYLGIGCKADNGYRLWRWNGDILDAARETHGDTLPLRISHADSPASMVRNYRIAESGSVWDLAEVVE